MNYKIKMLFVVIITILFFTAFSMTGCQNADASNSETAIDTSTNEMATQDIDMGTTSDDYFKYFKEYSVDSYGQKITAYTYDDFYYLLNTDTKELATSYDDSESYDKFLDRYVNPYYGDTSDNLYNGVQILKYFPYNGFPNYLLAKNLYEFNYIKGVDFIGYLDKDIGETTAIAIELRLPKKFPDDNDVNLDVVDFHGLKSGMTIEEVIDIMGDNEFSRDRDALLYKEKDLYYTIRCYTLNIKDNLETYTEITISRENLSRDDVSPEETISEEEAIDIVLSVADYLYDWWKGPLGENVIANVAYSKIIDGVDYYVVDAMGLLPAIVRWKHS